MLNKKLTKYERVRLIGTRATQLSQGAPPTIDIEGITDVLDIATKELECKKIPIKIIRKLPNGTILEIDISELEL